MDYCFFVVMIFGVHFLAKQKALILLVIHFIYFSFFQPPHPDVRHGEILGYYLGYKVTNTSDPYRYQTLQVSKSEVRTNGRRSNF